MKWFLLQRFVNLIRTHFLLIVIKNHSNRVNIVLISGFRQIYAGCYPIHNVYFNDMQINRWQNFKDKGHLFTLNLLMTTKFVKYLFLEHLFLFLSINLFCSIADLCLISKFREILILLCRKIFFIFYPIFHKTFSDSYGFAII